MFTTIKSKLENINLVPPTENTSCDTGPSESQKHGSNDESKNTPLPSTQQPTLLITSYDRFTPPDPRPDLEYDCRTTSNPSKHVRSINTGIDVSLQAQLMGRDEFADMISRAEEEVKNLMEEKKKLVEREARDNANMTVRVGCLCGSGHHRSVAFAECLAKKEWPADWKVSVEHRDLTENVVESKKKRKSKALNPADEEGESG